MPTYSISANLPRVSQNVLNPTRKNSRFRGGFYARHKPLFFLLLFLTTIILVVLVYQSFLLKSEIGKEKRKFDSLTKDVEKPTDLVLDDSVFLAVYPSHSFEVRLRCKLKCRCVLSKESEAVIDPSVFWALKNDEQDDTHRVEKVVNRGQKEEEFYIKFSPQIFFRYSLACAQGALLPGSLIAKNPNAYSAAITTVGKSLFVIKSVDRLLKHFKHQTFTPFALKTVPQKWEAKLFPQSDEKTRESVLREFDLTQTRLINPKMVFYKNGAVALKGFIPRSLHLKCAFVADDVSEAKNELEEFPLEDKVYELFSSKTELENYEKRIYVMERMADDALDKNDSRPVRFKSKRLGLVPGTYSYYCSAFNLRPDKLKNITANSFHANGETFVFMDKLFAAGSFLYAPSEYPKEGVVIDESFKVSKFDQILTVLEGSSLSEKTRVLELLQSVGNSFLFDLNALREINPALNKEGLINGLILAKTLSRISTIKLDELAEFSFEVVGIFEKAAFYLEDILKNQNYSRNVLEGATKEEVELFEIEDANVEESKTNLYDSFNKLFFYASLVTKLFSSSNVLGLERVIYDRNISKLWSSFLYLIDCHEEPHDSQCPAKNKQNLFEFIDEKLKNKPSELLKQRNHKELQKNFLLSKEKSLRLFK